MTSENTCARCEKSFDELIGEFNKAGRNYATIMANAQLIKESGFSRVLDVKGDGNCLIYAIIVYLYNTRDLNLFAATLMPFCAGNSHIVEQLLTSPNEMIRDVHNMLFIAIAIRKQIVQKWDYKGEPSYHMDSNAIDGLAREMTMRLLGICHLTCFSLCPEKGENWKRDTQISSDKSDLRPDIEGKWHVYLLSQCGYKHYSAFLK